MCTNTSVLIRKEVEVWSKRFCALCKRRLTMSGQFSHGLFSCFDDCLLCLTTLFVPCYTMGKTAEAVGDDCLLCGLAIMVPYLNIYACCSNRGKIREQKGIPGSTISDVLTTCCCPLCALVQQAQEMGVKAPFGQSMSRE